MSNFVEVRFPGLGIDINVSPVAFRIGGLEVYWYGLLIALALILSVVLALKQAKRLNFPGGLIYDTILVIIPCAIIGARAYFVACNWDYYGKNLKEIFNLRNGGLAIYGGVILVFIGCYIMCYVRKIPFMELADYCVVYLPLGQAIGRWGNFFNQECFGTTTTLPWGMTSPTIESYLRYACPNLVSTMPVHPTFLYESLADLAIFFILLYIRKRSKVPFETSCAYFALYGTARFFIEGMRTDSLYIANTTIRISQLLSLIFVVAALLYIAYARAKKTEKRGFPSKLYETEKAGEGKKK
ncbi:MAG: prolipoprotein diacylglyceryl transferase [Clostridiales bacterium]|nr:prolipoprotein diacylglyceryl transferase [Clostridiales bacterium]